MPGSADVAHCIDLVKQSATDLYLADLLLPDACRDAVFVLHAFHVEVTNIPLIANEPLAGEVRLQWWADILGGQRNDEAQGHPVARALLQVLEDGRLSPAAFDAKLQAHVFDLYNDPMGDRSMLEGYLGETHSMLFQSAALLAGAEANSDLADASGHAGVAYGAAGLLMNLALHRNHQRVYIPSDLLTAVGLSSPEYLSEWNEKHTMAVQGMIELVMEHLTKAQTALSKLPEEQRSVFKPLALVALYLKPLKRAPDLAQSGWPQPPQWRRQWALWRG